MSLPLIDSTSPGMASPGWHTPRTVPLPILRMGPPQYFQRMGTWGEFSGGEYLGNEYLGGVSTQG